MATFTPTDAKTIGKMSDLDVSTKSGMPEKPWKLGYGKMKSEAMKLYLTIMLLLLLTGCSPINRYQQRATASCLAAHAKNPEVCRPLSYPSCEPGFTGKVCR